jgi:hypothetical protein
VKFFVQKLQLGGWGSVMENDPTVDDKTLINGSTVGSFLNTRNETPDAVLVERFNGDVLQMRLGGWGSVMKNDPQLDSNTYINAEAVDHLLDSQDKTPDEVLNRYITLGKSERSRINGSVERLTPVKYLSLTGFEFESKNDQGTELADAIKAKKQTIVPSEEPVTALIKNHNHN